MCPACFPFYAVLIILGLVVIKFFPKSRLARWLSTQIKKIKERKC